MEREKPHGRPRLSVVIPVYNERHTIEEILERVRRVDLDKEIVIVDDGSTDGTRELLEKLTRELEETTMAKKTASACYEKDRIRIFFQDKNCGKGAALRRGFREARGEIVIVQDADLEYDPDDYHAMIEPIEKGRADVVYGSRFLGGPHRVLLFWHSVGNWALTTLSNMLTDLNLSDVWTCYKAFRHGVLQEVQLRENRFGFEPEITAEIARGRWRVYEVPISYHGRTYSEGKKITWKDGLWGIWVIVRCKLVSWQGRRAPGCADIEIR